MRTRVSQRRKPLMLTLLLSATAVALTVGAAPVAASSPRLATTSRQANSTSAPLTTFTFQLHNTCVQGVGPANTTLHVELRGTSGSYQGHFNVTTDGSGNWGYKCFWGAIDPGDQLVATDGTTTRTYDVQPIKYTIDRVSDVITGKSLPNSQVTVFVMDCFHQWYTCYSQVNQSVPTSGTGKFWIDTSNQYDIRGGDYVQVHLQDTQGDDQYRALYAPMVETWVGNNEAWGEANPDTSVEISLFQGNGTLKARFDDHVNPWGGYFGSGWFASSGRAVDALAGDWVVGDFASDATYRLIDSKATFNPATDDVSGKCWKNKAFVVYAEHTDGDGATVYVPGVADGTGHFTVNTMTADSYDLRSGDIVDLQCRDKQGDEQETTFQVD